MHPLRSVLCASDLSDASALAVEQAAELAARDGARLTVVHVLPVPAVPFTGMDVAPPVVVAEDVVAAAQADLARRLAASTRTASADRQVIRATGSIASEILRRADELRADLVVVGSHRHSRLERVLLGSTAAELTRHAHRPVLVARQPIGRGTVVAATDLTTHSLPALRAAAEEARRRGAALLAAHCLQLPSPVVSLGSAVPPAEPDDPRSPQALRREAEARLREYLRQAEVDARPVVAEGGAGPSLVALAQQSGAELIAVGRSSRSALKQALLGSVAEAVVGGAPCSVLVVPEPRD